MSRATLPAARRALLALGVLMPLTAQPAGGTPPAEFNEECGACHVAYPARFLPPIAWATLMKRLGDHFGTDASLDAPTSQVIARYLDSHARRKGADSAASLRITEQRWFAHEHRRVLKRLPLPGVGSAADCGGCHRRAADGSFREREIRIPSTGEMP